MSNALCSLSDCTSHSVLRILSVLQMQTINFGVRRILDLPSLAITSETVEIAAKCEKGTVH